MRRRARPVASVTTRSSQAPSWWTRPEARPATSVITQLADRDQRVTAPGARDRHGTLLRQFGAINGTSWPHTERLRQPLGDSVRWRMVNASPEAHPMHLHGFYFRVDAHGVPEADADSIYAPSARRMVVTETIGPRQTATIVWSPDRPGGWLFHCHLTSHVVKMPPLDSPDIMEFPRLTMRVTPTSTP